MRILQLIDSLETGGAERMAVNYANALAKKNNFSGLIATRKEGNLKNQISPKVSYFFLNKKSVLDFGAVLKLKAYCQKNDIDYVQAHSSSFFLAVLLKLTLPKIKVIWHDHYGLSDFLDQRKSLALKIASYFFDGIIAVNAQLKNWAQETLYCSKVIYLPNFTVNSIDEKQETRLLGKAGKRILCLANLRVQKNHFLLLEVAKKIKATHPDWTFHLVGKDFEDDYSKTLKSAITSNDLKNTVFIYGTKNDIKNIIEQTDIAILTSQSEGLPVALLEYGQHKKPVVTTAVGEIPLIIKNDENGFLVSKGDIEGFYRSLLALIENEGLRCRLAQALKHTISENHSSEAVIDKLLVWL